MKSKILLVAVAVLTSMAGLQCQKKATVPEQLIGVWQTTDPKYADHPFEIKEDTLIFEQGLGYFDFDVFPIVDIEKSNADGQILYIIHYLIPAGRKFEFSFYYLPEGGGTIRFKNQPEMKWTKRKS